MASFVEPEQEPPSSVTLLTPSLGTGDHAIPYEAGVVSLSVALTNHTRLQSHIILCEPDTSNYSNIHGLNVHNSDHLNLDDMLVMRPTVVVVECNWRFAPNANRLSKTIHNLPCDKDCRAPTGARAGELAGSESALVERCYPIRVDERHILRTKYEVEWLIYVRTINLNPNRPECIDEALEDRVQVAQASLERTYNAVFDTCASILSQPTITAPLVSVDDASLSTSVINEFGPYRHPGKAQHSGGNWRRALYDIMEKEKQLPKQIYYSNSDCVVIYDGFSKAHFHLLVLPRAACFQNNTFVKKACELTLTHLETITRIHDLAYHIAEHLCESNGRIPVRVGYHAIPSMEPLHIHIISQDFHSDCLKNKKHWNSFMSPFFIDAHQLQGNLEAGRSPLYPVVKGVGLADSQEASSLLDAPLVCSTPVCNCQRKFVNMPALKQHMSEVFERKTSQNSSKKFKMGV